MSLRLEMVQVARLAPKVLGESAELVEAFLRSGINPDGGFCNRGGRSDLYYTVFGLEALTALNAALPSAQVSTYLQGFGDGDGLDFVHLCCLARAWAGITKDLRAAPAAAIRRRIETYRSGDGGYSQSPGTPHGSVYAAFLAVGACQDLGAAPPDANVLLRSLESSRAADGGYANQPGSAAGLTTSTAAAVTLYRQFHCDPDPALADWLLRRCLPTGGFFASAAAPVPDLLSTATALHALAGLHVQLDPIRDACLDFLDTLWTNRGGFYGSWADDHLDAEYTYYGLLALGHLTD